MWHWIEMNWVSLLFGGAAFAFLSLIMVALFGDHGAAFERDMKELDRLGVGDPESPHVTHCECGKSWTTSWAWQDCSHCGAKIRHIPPGERGLRYVPKE